MKPKKILCSRKLVSGISVRTQNSEEFEPKTAKIGELWNTFFTRNLANNIPGRLADTPLVGVYSNYASDVNDYYDATAGVLVSGPNADFSCVVLHPGLYLVFEARGEMPEAIMEAWDGVWKYFEQHGEITRSYLSDYELYTGPNEVQIYVGVED